MTSQNGPEHVFQKVIVGPQCENHVLLVTDQASWRELS